MFHRLFKPAAMGVLAGMVSRSSVVFADDRNQRRGWGHFPDSQLHEAASWWAQYLPGVRDVTAAELKRQAQIEPHPLDDYFNQKNRKKHVTEEQINKFTSFLAGRMAYLDARINFHDGPAYVELGNSCSYDVPELILAALHHAEIKGYAGMFFPPKTEMRIYKNGHIQVNGQVICTNPSELHYDATTVSFDHAPHVVIKGKRFRILEVNYSPEKEHLLDAGFISELKENGGTLYAKVYQSDFRNERDFLFLSDSELEKRLFNEKRIGFLLKNMELVVGISTEKNFLLKTNDSFNRHFHDTLGEYTAENTSREFYRHQTGVMQIMRVHQKGTVGKTYLRSVQPGDYILRCEGENSLVYLPKNTPFEALRCDAQGRPLADRAVSLKDIDMPETAAPENHMSPAFRR